MIMIKKTLYIISAILSILSISLITWALWPTEDEKSNPETQEVKQEEDDEYTSKMMQAIKDMESEFPPALTGDETGEELYKNPYVVHIRTALDNYLNGSNIGVEEALYMNSVNIEMEETEPSEHNCRLSDFKDYFDSKFFLYDVENNEYGGLHAWIVFTDKPDKIFLAWVYLLGAGDGEYSLRTLCEAGPPEEDKEEFIKIMKEYINSEKFKYSI